LGSKEWVGDQIVIDSKKPRLLSVVARSKLTIYEIDLKDFFLKMPSDFVK
jgi:hypothetical protein